MNIDQLEQRIGQELPKTREWHELRNADADMFENCCSCSLVTAHNRAGEMRTELTEALLRVVGEKKALREYADDGDEKLQQAEADLAAMTKKDREHYESWKKDQAAWKKDRDDLAAMTIERDEAKTTRENANTALLKAERDLSAARKEARKWEWVARELFYNPFACTDTAQWQKRIDRLLARYQPAEELTEPSYRIHRVFGFDVTAKESWAREFMDGINWLLEPAEEEK